MRFHRLGALLAASSLLLGCGAARPTLAPTSVTGEAADLPETAPATEATAQPAPVPLRLPCAADDPVGCTHACEEDEIVEDCVTLGAMYLDGKVMRADHQRAIDLFRSACTQGSARGCLKLADVYHDGHGNEDPAEEAALYRKACDAGANRGCVSAGKAYLEGRVVGKDPVFAASLFTRVCERGNAEACLELAHLYDRGEGVRKDAARALALFTKACQLGLDEGCLIASRAGEMIPPRF